MSQPLFHEWDLVTIDGLQSAAGSKLNGLTATIFGTVPLEEGDAPTSQRFECFIPHRENTVAIKAANLTKQFPRVRVMDSGKHGRGVFAVEDIKAGEYILRERALVPPSAEDFDYPAFKQAVRELTENDWKLLRRMHIDKRWVERIPKGRQGAPSGSIQEMEGIAWTNEFEQIGTCPVLSQCNHDCNPSASFYCDEELQEEYFFSNRDIAAGEEITVSYLGGDQAYWPTAERKEHLLETKGFDCQCSLCALPEEQAAARDEVLEEIDYLRDEFPEHSSSDPKHAYEMACKQQQLMESLGTTIPASLMHCTYGEIVQLLETDGLQRVLGAEDAKSESRKWRKLYVGSFKLEPPTAANKQMQLDQLKRQRLLEEHLAKMKV